ncbi:tetratricopeptide repeat protein [Acidobacteriota bacterium]
MVDSIGKGGMGEVYIGFDEKLKRKVALKAIRGDKRLDERAKARFIREAEILSKLEHPNICRIYDLVETDDADVLVLELIKGIDLVKAQKKGLNPSEKLKIAVQICEVLTDAHAHRVVHRDLKPENIMIDERGEVKVLDFGLAYSINESDSVSKTWIDMTADDLKKTNEEPENLSGGGFKTELGIIMGTPLYMSPEQARCEPVSSASDMYSFGLLLQWLFTEKSPYPANLSPREIFVKAANGETIPPVSVELELRKLIERLKTVDPNGRPTALDTLERLNWIVESPRRRAKRMTIGAIIFALSLGIIISCLSLIHAKKSERQERIARVRQEKMSDFLVDMWIAPSPMEQGKDIKVIDVLAYGKEKVETEFHDDPLLKAELLNHLGTTYRRLGEYELAESIMSECLEFCRETLGPNHQRTITVMIDLGILFSYDERFQEAESLFRDALNLGKNDLEPDDELLLYAKVQIIDILLQKAAYSEAKTLLQEILPLIQGDKDLKYKFGPKVLLSLGNIYLDEEDFPEAEKIFLELQRDYEEKGDTKNPNYIAAKGSVARAFMLQNKHREGLRHMREGLELSTQVNGERHRNTVVFLINLGMGLTEIGQYEEAIIYIERGYEIFKEIFGNRAPDTVFISVVYANCLREIGRYVESESLLNEAVPLNLEILGQEHPNTLESQYVLSNLYCDAGRTSEAEDIIQKVLETSMRLFGEENQIALDSKDLLGIILTKKADYKQAEQFHREVLEIKIKTQGDSNSSIADTLHYLAENLFQQGKIEESCQYIEQSTRMYYKTWGPKSSQFRKIQGIPDKGVYGMGQIRSGTGHIGVYGTDCG